MTAINLAEIEKLKLTENLSTDWMYSAIRHCIRNLDFEVSDGGNTPDRYEGPDMAAALNAFPALLSWVKRAAEFIQMSRNPLGAQGYSFEENGRKLLAELGDRTTLTPEEHE